MPLISKITINYKTKNTIYLKIIFHKLDKLEYTCQINPQIFEHINLSLTTLQKNNKIEWIKDWIQYYYLHGVNRLILYDNNSENREELISELNKIDINLEIILVKWDFKYGPYRSNCNQFCQTGSLTHALYMFHSTNWMINCDIDEYILSQNDLILKDYLKPIDHSIAVIYMDSYRMSNIIDIETESIDLSTFKYREKGNVAVNFKYIYRPELINFCSPHVALKKSGEEISVKESQLYFLHYIGLTTNWKPYWARLEKLKFNPDKHFYNDQVRRFLIEKQLLKKVTIYQPNTLAIPYQYNLQRNFYSDKTDITNLILTGEDYSDYDRDVIFYDIFFNTTNDKIIALGPNLVNLEDKFMKFSCFITHNSDYSDLKSIGKCVIDKTNTKIKITFNYQSNESVYLKFIYPELNNLEYRCTVKPNKYSRKNLAITTLQKNNKLEWILNWIEYYFLHGVQRVILYDNQSDDRQNLIAQLDQIEYDIEIILVIWDYKYGPAKSVANQFCQPGSLTHSCLKFGQENWLINADIDEYIIHQNCEISIAKYLKELDSTTKFIKIDSYLRPNIKGMKEFNYRNKQKVGQNHKYIVDPNVVYFCMPHDAVLKNGEKIETNQLYFNHYIGLTTNWKKHLDRTSNIDFNPASHIYDDSVSKFINYQKYKNIYIPNTISLPDSYPLKRNLRINERHTDGKELTINDLEQYDDKTIFYDIFLDSDNKHIMAIVPPMFSLKKLLTPFEFIISDNIEFTNIVNLNQYQINQSEGEILPIVKLIFEYDCSKMNKIFAKIKFSKLNNLEFEFQIKKNILKSTKLTLTTIQKDNRIHWIKDWIEYYSYHGINRLILYDNNSQNRDQLIKELQKITNMEIIIVLWDYKYGPYQSHKNQYCQPSSLIHCCSKYGQTQWMLNVDIDEYVISRQNRKISNYLKDISETVSFIYLNNFIVPNITEDDYQNIRLSSFKHRNIQMTKGGQKYLIRPKDAKFCLPHGASLLRGEKVFSKELLFLHYIGLTTNWKPYGKRMERLEVDKTKYIEDSSVINFFKENSQKINFDGWAISEDLFNTIKENLKNNSTLLEFGSGTGTIELTKYYKMISIEHDKKWLNKAESKYIYAQLENIEINPKFPNHRQWYNYEIIKNELKDIIIDGILIDGPPGKIGRSGILKFIEENKKRLLQIPIFVDDCQRNDEKKLAIEIAEILNKKPKFYEPDGKSYCIIKDAYQYNNIFLYWEKERPVYLDLCLETIKKHCQKHFKIIILTPENINKFLPNIHPKWKDMPIPAQKADYLRIAILYYYGGFYFDFDTIVLQSIKPWLEKLQDYELVWANNSNFGGQKGSTFLKICLQVLNHKLNKSSNLQFIWAELGATISEIKKILSDKINQYKIPEDEYNGKKSINWKYDNSKTGFISNQSLDEYYHEKQKIVILHNNLYKKIKEMTKEEVLESEMLLSKYLNFSFSS